MPKVSITEAIRMVGISRSHFYGKYINKGLISLIVEDGKRLIDTSELIRVFGTVQIQNNSKNVSEQLRTPENYLDFEEKNQIIDLLRKQLEEAKNRELQATEREKQAQEREIQAREREAWLQKQIEELKEQSKLLEDKNKKSKKFMGIF